MMRIVFMGTPDFAVASLKALAEQGTDEIVGVFTQPDRPKGRGQKMLMTPVKEYALERGYEVYQPQRVKTPEVIELLRGLAPDLIVVAAFGQFLPKEILEMPKYGCINVHASLLPKYRGAAPIHYVILNGETKSGVTIMQMDIGMDTGDMLAKAEVEITPEMTMGELHDSLKEIGGKLLLETVEKIKRGEITPVKQMMLKQLTHICLRAIWKLLTGTCLRRIFIIKYVPLILHRVRLLICPAAKNLKYGVRKLPAAAAPKQGKLPKF